MDAVTIVLAITAIAGLYMAWNIGANDVANAMGTSVGSGALTLRQAIIVAATFELIGALTLGRNVSETIRGGIVQITSLDQSTLIIAAGMACCLIAAAIWLHVATSAGWPVSTTHAIVGSVAGFGLWAGGVDAVSWETLGAITLSWLASPLLGAFFGFVFFLWIRRSVLSSSDPTTTTRRLGPWMTAFVIGVAASAIVTNQTLAAQLPIHPWAIVGGVAACGWVLAFVLLRSRLAGAELERLFGNLQMVTACFVAFAHGSNDVANAVGPMAAVFGVVQGSTIEDNVVPTNLLIIGAFGIVLGLSTYGFKVMATIGREITELTPSRGFAAELAGATVIVTASNLGLPVSTTHTIVGAVVGVGMARSFGALNLGILRRILASWIVTVPVCALLAAILVQIVSWVL